MTLREAKQAVRAYIRTWSTQRVAEVYAFNQDGKMSFGDACGCIRGVATAAHLHIQVGRQVGSRGLLHRNRDVCPEYLAGMGFHYELQDSDIAHRAEHGYGVLSGAGYLIYGAADQIRQRRLSPILRAELRLRARAESRKAVEQEVVSV